jgi:tetratricopeptide (TPR) repeat protein
VYQSRLGLDDRSEHVAYRLALARYRDGDIDAALTALAQALRLNDRLPDPYYLLGLCLRDKRRLPEAVKAFETAVTRAPAMVPAREELAELYRSLGRSTDELEQLQYIALLDRANAERQVALGLAQARTGHGELAVLTLGNALERTSSQAPIYARSAGVSRAPVRSDAEQGARGARTRGVDRCRHERRR